MEKFRNIADCIQAEKESISYYDCRIKAWESVAIKTKKDGTEYADFTNRCVEGARIKGDELIVSFKDEKGAYNYDYIKIYGFCDELPKEDERSVDRKTQGFVRARYDRTQNEMREQIAIHIEKYKEWKRKNELAEEYLIEIAEEFAKDIETLKAKYLTRAKDIDRSIRYHTADAIKNMWLGY